MKISSWSVWLLHYRLLSSHHYSIWAPSSSTLNTTTNICHVLFAFASSPLGKNASAVGCPVLVRFLCMRLVWGLFFNKKDAFFWISVRKGKMEERRSTWSGAQKYLQRSLCVWVGVVQLSQTNREELLTILGWFFVGEKQSWTCLKTKSRSARCQIAAGEFAACWIPTTSQGLPLSTQQHYALATVQGEQKGYF